ncbi:hypothetical protein, partial [Stenotrophomonas maltophilia group sp. RNC7]|uniref:hypothetical protein n=1 Tax=Stenotrophomonas maltophilia group sp. RNC7 TaxID=3071467 RepID=UPI0027DFAE75
LSGDNANNTYANSSAEERERQRKEAADRAAAYNGQNPGQDLKSWWEQNIYGVGRTSAGSLGDGRDDAMGSFLDGPVVKVETQQAVSEAQAASSEIQNALNVTVGPTVDTSGLDALHSKLLACVASLGQLRAGIPATVSDLSSQLNRSFSDHQLTP